jgi:hypothetical protein
MLIASDGTHMSSHDHEHFDDDEATADEWEEFRDNDFDPIDIEDLKRLSLKEMPEGVCISVMDDYFPETMLTRDGEFLICEHLYTKYWEHKFSAYAFADAMERAVRRLSHEGHPLLNPSRDDDDVHIFVRWQLRVPGDSQSEFLVESIKSAFDLV